MKIEKKKGGKCKKLLIYKRDFTLGFQMKKSGIFENFLKNQIKQ